MHKVKISIVTVCLNTVNTIRRTIESVLEQTYRDLEYVIIDGMSTDGTLDMIQMYEGIRGLRVVSAEDSGLYNAMNKGIDICSGDYIIFLNSGDIFADSSVVGDAVAQICGNDETDQVKEGIDWNLMPDIVYGNVTKIYKDERVTEKYPGRYTVFKLLMMGKMPCHQGVFAKAAILREYKFDESYRICADFDFLIRCVHDHVSMRYVDVDISIVDCVTGISSQDANIGKMRAEDDRSIRGSYPLMYYLMWAPKRIARLTGKKRR